MFVPWGKFFLHTALDWAGGSRERRLPFSLLPREETRLRAPDRTSARVLHGRISLKRNPHCVVRGFTSIYWRSEHTVGCSKPSEAIMRVIPERFADTPARLANTGSYFAFGVACFLFGLMLLFLIADTIIAIIRIW